MISIIIINMNFQFLIIIIKMDKLLEKNANIAKITNIKPKKMIKSKEIIDNYTMEILQRRFNAYKTTYIDTVHIITTTNLPIRHQNPPEDITENITKFIIHNYDNDTSCKWAKCIGLNGDLYSDKYDHDSPIEVKAFISNGPSSFGPTKKFGVIYFLDMHKWLENIFILWKVNLNYNSPEWKQIKMNKTQTYSDQCNEKRRPHISWDKIYSQLSTFCNKVYEGPFENIFINQLSSTAEVTFEVTAEVTSEVASEVTAEVDLIASINRLAIN